MGPTSVRSRRLWRINSWPAANGIICSSCAPSSTIEPEGTWRAMASRMVNNLDSAVISSRPEMIGIEFAHDAQFRVAWRLSFHQLVRNAERPAGIREDFFDAHAGMHGRKKGFAIVAETQHAQSGDDGRRAGRERQTLRAAPAFTVAKSGRRNVADTVAQTRAIMSQQHHGAPREARNVASSAGTGQALHFFVAMAPSGVEIAETIHFGGAEKADVHAAL